MSENKEEIKKKLDLQFSKVIKIDKSPKPYIFMGSPVTLEASERNIGYFHVMNEYGDYIGMLSNQELTFCLLPMKKAFKFLKSDLVELDANGKPVLSRYSQRKLKEKKIIKERLIKK